MAGLVKRAKSHFENCNNGPEETPVQGDCSYILTPRATGAASPAGPECKITSYWYRTSHYQAIAVLYPSFTSWRNGLYRKRGPSNNTYSLPPRTNQGSEIYRKYTRLAPWEWSSAASSECAPDRATTRRDAECWKQSLCALHSGGLNVIGRSLHCT